MTNQSKINPFEWLELYANKPIKKPTKEEAVANLQRLGVLDSEGNVKPEYVEVARCVLKGELND